MNSDDEDSYWLYAAGLFFGLFVAAIIWVTIRRFYF
jgi:hypothetical protein